MTDKDINVIFDLHKKGLSSYSIAKQLNKKRTTVSYWLQKYKCESNFKSFGNGYSSRNKKSKYEDIDWDTIQVKYNSGLSIRELMKHFSDIPKNSFEWARKRGILKTRTRSESCKLAHKKFPKLHQHSSEIRDKISKKLIEYLNNNPDEVPYRKFHNGEKSYPEMVFENALISNKIYGWEYDYPNGIYNYDFAFIDLKIDVEIDGGTHLQDDVIKKDKRRDEWSISNGWQVIRFTAKEVKSDVNQCISKLKEFMTT